MSAILAVCGDTFCAMVSDGRYVEEPITGEKPHILKNDLPKVRKINRNVVVGFAGDTLAAVQIINAVDEYQTQYLTLEKVVKILREKAATVSVQPVGRCSSSRFAPMMRSALCRAARPCAVSSSGVPEPIPISVTIPKPPCSVPKFVRQFLPFRPGGGAPRAVRPCPVRPVPFRQSRPLRRRPL